MQAGRAVGAAAVAKGVHHRLAQRHADEDRLVGLQAAGDPHADRQLLDVVEGGLAARARPRGRSGRTRCPSGGGGGTGRGAGPPRRSGSSCALMIRDESCRREFRARSALYSRTLRVSRGGPPEGVARARRRPKEARWRGYKVRLGDGSEIGPMDLEALKTWQLQGLVDGDSPVMRSGSRSWVPLAHPPGVQGGHPLRGVPLRKKKKEKKAKRASGRRLRRGPHVRRPAGGSAPSGCLLLVVAAGLGFVAWRPDVARPAFDGAPWWQIALGARGARPRAPARLGSWGGASCRLVLLLAAFALFPLAGILIAQGERGAALLAARLRLGPRSRASWRCWPARSGGSGWSSACCRSWPAPTASSTSAARRSPRRRSRSRSWSSPERRFTDDAIGLTLDLPDGWVALRPGNPLVAAPDGALVTIAQPRLGGRGYLIAEPAPRGVATPDQYLDHLMARRAGRAARRSRSRDARTRSSGPWPAVASTPPGPTPACPVRDLTVAGLDGWMSFALVAWMPEATASRPGGLDALAGALSARGLLAPRLQRRRAGRGRGGAPPHPAGGRAADGAERGAGPRARPGLPALGRRPRGAHPVAVEQPRRGSSRA